MHELGPAERDASLADFSHALGHSCAHCEGIRDIGPDEAQNPMRRLMACAHGRIVEPPRKSKRELRNEVRRERKAKRGYRALALAIRAA